MVQPECSDVEHRGGVFAHLDDASAIDLGRDEVQVGHLCDRMAEGIVAGALGDLASVEVCNRDAKHQGGLCRGQHLEAIA